MANVAPGSFRRHCKRREGEAGGAAPREGGAWGPTRGQGAGCSPRPPRGRCPRRSACAAPRSSTCGRLTGCQEGGEDTVTSVGPPGPHRLLWAPQEQAIRPSGHSPHPATDSHVAMTPFSVCGQGQDLPPRGRELREVTTVTLLSRCYFPQCPSTLRTVTHCLAINGDAEVQAFR